MENPIESPFYTVEEAAIFLRMKVTTLDAMRWRNDCRVLPKEPS